MSFRIAISVAMFLLNSYVVSIIFLFKQSLAKKVHLSIKSCIYAGATGIHYENGNFLDNAGRSELICNRRLVSKQEAPDYPIH